jgi:PII-like signaling protein
MAIQITLYLNEADKWHGRPLHVALLNCLREENVFAATVFHAVGGFFGRQRVKSAHLVDAGGKLPVVLTFVDHDEHISRVLPKIKEMAPNHLMVRESVTIEQGSLD